MFVQNVSDCGLVDAKVKTAMEYSEIELARGEILVNQSGFHGRNRGGALVFESHDEPIGFTRQWLNLKTTRVIDTVFEIIVGDDSPERVADDNRVGGGGAHGFNEVGKDEDNRDLSGSFKGAHFEAKIVAVDLGRRTILGGRVLNHGQKRAKVVSKLNGCYVSFLRSGYVGSLLHFCVLRLAEK